MKIHCIEGLGCYYLRPLTKAVQSLNLGVEVVTYPWTVKPESLLFSMGDILIGHSYGGWKAWEAANYLGREYRPSLLFMVDARQPLTTNPIFENISSFVKTYNYLQTGFVRGYRVVPVLEKTENHLIKGFSHYRMPQNPAFLFKLMEVVKTSNASV